MKSKGIVYCKRFKIFDTYPIIVVVSIFFLYVRSVLSHAIQFSLSFLSYFTQQRVLHNIFNFWPTWLRKKLTRKIMVHLKFSSYVTRSV